MGKRFDNFKENCGFFDKDKKTRYLNIGITVIILASFCLMFYLWRKQIREQEEIARQREEERLSSYTCIYTDKELRNKIEEIGFVRKWEDFDFYEYKDYDLDIFTQYIMIDAKRENFNLREYYEIINSILDVDAEVFEKTIDVLDKAYNSDEKTHLVKLTYGHFGMQISVTSYKYSVNIYNCTYDGETREFESLLFSKDDIVNYDTWMIKREFDIDFQYADLISYMKEESVKNTDRSSLEVKELFDISIWDNGRIDYDFDYNSHFNRIEYEITHSFDDYKEKLEKDFEYIKKYFNEDIGEGYQKIVDIIDNWKFKSWERDKDYNGNSYYGNTIEIDSNTTLRLKVYEDKISFDFDFKE